MSEVVRESSLGENRGVMTTEDQLKDINMAQIKIFDKQALEQIVTVESSKKESKKQKVRVAEPEQEDQIEQAPECINIQMSELNASQQHRSPKNQTLKKQSPKRRRYNVPKP